MLDVNAQIRHGETAAPFRSWNYDSWWYYKCDNSAVKNWTATGDTFPSGLEHVYQGDVLLVSIINTV